MGGEDRRKELPATKECTGRSSSSSSESSGERGSLGMVEAFETKDMLGA